MLEFIAIALELKNNMEVEVPWVELVLVVCVCMNVL